MSVTAGIPFFTEIGWEVSAEETFEYAYGESYSETIEVRFVVLQLWVFLLPEPGLILISRYCPSQLNYQDRKSLGYSVLFCLQYLFFIWGWKASLTLFVQNSIGFTSSYHLCVLIPFVWTNLSGCSPHPKVTIRWYFSGVCYFAAIAWRLKWQSLVNIPVKFPSWLVRWWWMFHTMRLSLFTSVTTPPQQST